MNRSSDLHHFELTLNMSFPGLFEPLLALHEDEIIALGARLEREDGEPIAVTKTLSRWQLESAEAVFGQFHPLLRLIPPGDDTLEYLGCSFEQEYPLEREQIDRLLTLQSRPLSQSIDPESTLDRGDYSYDDYLKSLENDYPDFSDDEISITFTELEINGEAVETFDEHYDDRSFAYLKIYRTAHEHQPKYALRGEVMIESDSDYCGISSHAESLLEKFSRRIFALREQTITWLRERQL